MAEFAVLGFEDIVQKLKSSPHPSRASYMAMYSSWFGGIIQDPQLMMVPVDDHIVHRGDGVFEAIKCLEGRIYGLERHLKRMYRSAEPIGLQVPATLEELTEICIQTVRASKAQDCLLRLYVSRGPGGFTTNPYECIAPQIYLVITAFRAVPAEKYQNGVSTKVSSFTVKEGFFATVKSCNYLPNVMMKKEAVDAGFDFTLSKDENGNLAEGSTENFAIVSREGELLVPGFERTLRGVTAVRAMELAQKLVQTGQLKAVRHHSFRAEDVEKASEAMFLGTTLDCLPVTRFENSQINGGKVGPVCQALLEMIRQDMKSGPLVTHVRY